jgi:peptidylprolyl isomerase
MKTIEFAGFKINALYLLVVVAFIVLIGVGYMTIAYASVPVVAVGDTINVSYTGTFTNGTVFDSNVGKPPLQFTVGSGQLIKGFDQGVIGMKLNEEKTIIVPANEAYGEINPSLIIQVPASSFGNHTVQAGMGVSRTVNGTQEQGVITSVNKTTVTVDFNPALAGQTLIFKVKILAINKG